MKTIYLVRHGESQSQSGETEDRINPILSSRGEAQAEALAAQFEQIAVNKVFLSPLLRAWMTYRLSGVKPRSVCVTSLLAEDHPHRPNCYAQLLASPDPPIFPGDEDDAWELEGPERGRRLLVKLLKDKAQTIVCFGHLMIFNYLLQVFLGFEHPENKRRIHLDNCRFTKLMVEPDGTRWIYYLNSPTLLA